MSKLFADVTELCYRGVLPDDVVDRMVSKANECPDCKGTGIIDEQVKESFASQRISPRFKQAVCNTCGGTGREEND